MNSSESLIAATQRNRGSYRTMNSIHEEDNAAKQVKVEGLSATLIKKTSSVSIVIKPKVIPVSSSSKSVSKFFRGSNPTSPKLTNQSGNFDPTIFNALHTKLVKKHFEESQRNMEADLKFNSSEKNLKGLLDELLVENTGKRENLEKKEAKLINMKIGSDFCECEKKYDNTFGNHTPFTTEANLNNAEYLTEVLRKKIELLKFQKEKIKNERKVAQNLNFMKEKRQKNYIFFHNECSKTEKFLEILESQKVVIDKTSNDIMTNQILSKMTFSEFKKDLSANTKFQRSIIDRKKLLENHDQISLKKEISQFLKESVQVNQFKESLVRTKKEIKELEERTHFLENVQLHVKKDSLDYIDRISDLFIYSKPEEFFMENILEINCPLLRKRNQESSESISRQPNRNASQKLLKKLSGLIHANIMQSRNKVREKSIMNIQMPSLIALRMNSNASNMNLTGMNGSNNKGDKEKGKVVERETLMMRINDFYNKHQNNIPELANLIIQEHVKLAFQEESLNSIIFDLTEQLRKYKKTYTKVVETLNDLLKQNDNAEFFDQQNNDQINPKKNVSGEEQTLALGMEDEFSTIVGLKLEINGFQIDKTSEFKESQKFQLFLFQCYFFFQENMLRLLSTLFAVCHKITDDLKLKLFVQSMFEKLNENYEDISQNEVYQQIKRTTETNLAGRKQSVFEALGDNKEKNEESEAKKIDRLQKKQKHKYELHTKFKEMQTQFFSVFPNFRLAFADFLEMMQSDIVLYSFFSKERFKELLENLESKFSESIRISKNVPQENLFMNLFFEEINKFKQISYQSFQKDLEKTLTLFEKLFGELNFEKKEIREKCENLRLAKNSSRRNTAAINYAKQSTLEPLEEDELMELGTPKKIYMDKKQILKPILKDIQKKKINEVLDFEHEELIEQEYFRMTRKETKVF